MYKILKQCSLLICALFTLGVSAGDRAVDNRKVVIEQYKWFGEEQKVKLVRVVNPYGSVTSRSSLGHVVELSGTVQKIGDNPPEHKVDINEENGVTEIVISYPKGSIRNAKGQLTGRFDLGVWIPSWVRLEVETDFGYIKVKKSASDVVAKSNTGKISIGTSGHVEAFSEKGNISVDFYGERFRKQMKVVSQFGNVRVDLSQDTRVVLNASAAKGIKNNFDKYQAIEVTGDNHKLHARVTKPTKHKLQPVELYLAANQGSVNINIADKVSHKIRHTQPSFVAKQSLNQIKTKKNNQDGQQGNNTQASLAKGNN